MYEGSIEHNANGDAFLSRTVDAMAALSEAVKDGVCKIEFQSQSPKGSFYRVEFLDGDEWGDGSDLDTALRYALGAHFYTEAHPVS